MREQLIIKRQLSGDWHWLVRGADSHIFNRSDTGFHAEDACIADAKAHGFSTEQTLDRVHPMRKRLLPQDR